MNEFIPHFFSVFFNEFVSIQPQPSIYAWGIRVDEPMTMLTDLFVTSICLMAFLRIRTLYQSSPTNKYMALYFFGMAISTGISGIIGHGFLYAFGTSWKLLGWISSIISVLFIQAAVLELVRSSLNPNLRKLIIGVSVVECIVATTLTIWTLNFAFVVVHIAYGLIGIVFTLSWYANKQHPKVGYSLFQKAVGWAGVAALVHLNEIGAHTWFNHLDVSHVFVGLSMYTFFRATLAVEDEKILVSKAA